MFKSIQYKLYIYTLLLLATAISFSFCLFHKEYPWAIMLAVVLLIFIASLNKTYSKFNKNILFLLNALENGDYSFHFSETKLSEREKEMNQMMNRIKDILVNAKKEVIENENFLSIILQSVPTGTVIVDKSGIVQKVNQSALRMLGLSVFSHINQLAAIDESYPELFHQLKKEDNIQITLPTEKEELQISLQVSEIKMKRGMMRIITMNNIGNELETKEMESWIRLIRVMTHEIMNSIAPITSLSETMQSLLQSNKSNTEDTIEAFETINSTASGLLSFVESYRKFTSIPKPQKKAFHLNGLVDKIAKLHEHSIHEKDIDFSILADETNITVNMDEQLVAQVLINLIKNAIEAIEANSNEKIQIRINRKQKDKITLDIANTGKPISPDILPHIFIPFFTTKHSGSGIGLSVSRYIMRLHGGKLLHFVSPEGETVFQLTINL